MKIAIVPATDIRSSDLRASTYIAGACDAAIRRLAAVAERDVPTLFSPHDAAAILRELRDRDECIRVLSRRRAEAIRALTRKHV